MKLASKIVVLLIVISNSFAGDGGAVGGGPRLSLLMSLQGEFTNISEDQLVNYDQLKDLFVEKYSNKKVSQYELDLIRRFLLSKNNDHLSGFNSQDKNNAFKLLNEIRYIEFRDQAIPPLDLLELSDLRGEGGSGGEPR